jgi:hypothetical protein
MSEWKSYVSKPMALQARIAEHRESVVTSSGLAIAEPGDFIIQEPSLYARICKPEIFHATYSEEKD